MFSEKARAGLENRLPGWLPRQSWFSAHDRVIRQVTVRKVAVLPDAKTSARLVFLEIAFDHGEHELYSVPMAFAQGERAAQLRDTNARAVICDLKPTGPAAEGALYDALVDPDFCGELLELVSLKSKRPADGGQLHGCPTAVFHEILGEKPLPEAVPGQLEQRKPSATFGDEFIMKWFRRLGPGLNPDIEISGFLTERKFPHVQRSAGSLEFIAASGEKFSLALLSEYVPNARNVWEFTRDAIGRYYERIASEAADGLTVPELEIPLCDVAEAEMPAVVVDVMGTYLESARVLGERTAELHGALTSDGEDPAFAPEPFTSHYVRGLFQSMRTNTTHKLRLLRKQLPSLPPDLAETARGILEREPEIMKTYQVLQERRLAAIRIRCHRDFNLCQVLYTGKDFTFIDFEGDPSSPVSERTIKRCALRDVAGMIRSFHQAAWTDLSDPVERGGIEPDRVQTLDPWARLWYRAVSLEYLRAYLAKASEHEALAQSTEDVAVMLPAYLFNQLMYDLGRELSTRPEQVHVPLAGILSLLDILHPEGAN